MAYNKQNFEARQDNAPNDYYVDGVKKEIIKSDDELVSNGTFATPSIFQNNEDATAQLATYYEQGTDFSVSGTDITITTDNADVDVIKLYVTSEITGGNITINANGDGAYPVLNPDGSNVDTLPIGQNEFLRRGTNFILRPSGIQYEDITTFSDNFTTTDNITEITDQATQDTTAGTIEFTDGSTYSSKVVTGGTNVTEITTDTLSSIDDRIDDTNAITDVVGSTVLLDEALNSDSSFDMAVENGVIYYNNSSDGGSLYKINSDGTGRTKLNSDNSTYITVENGVIYYRNDSDNGYLYKINSDGTGRTALNSDISRYITVENGVVYYQNNSDNGYLYKINSDGTGRSALNSDISTYIAVENGVIYYRNGSNSNYLYKINSDGTGREALNSDISAHITVENGVVYYRNTSDNNYLYKIDSDGTGRTQLNNDASYDIAVENVVIYYRNFTDGGSLYKINSDGTSRTKLNSDDSRDITVENGVVYYQNFSDNNYLYAYGNIPQYTLTLTNPITTVPDDVLTIYPKAYPNQRLLFNTQTFEEDVEDVFTKLTQDSLLTGKVKTGVTDSTAVTLSEADKTIEVGDTFLIDGSLIEVTNVVNNPVTYDVTTPTQVVSQSYETDGNGGRKIVRLDNGDLIAVLGEATGDNLRFYKSTNDGDTWTLIETLLIDNANDHALVTDGINIYLLVAKNLGTTDSVEFYVYDSDGNQQSSSTVDSSQTAMGSCSLVIAPNGDLHAAWSSKNSSYPNAFNIRYSESTDGGVTWDSATQVTTFNSTGVDGYTEPCIIIDDLGNPHVITKYSSNGPDYRIRDTRYNGSSWESSVNIYQGSIYPQYNPSADVLADGTIVVAWCGTEDGDTSSDIRFSQSIDNGATWSAMEKLTTGSFLFPSITRNKNNTIFIVFYDSGGGGIRLIEGESGNWGVVQSLVNNNSNNPSTVSNYREFSKPITIWQDDTNGGVSFYGKWTEQVDIDLTLDTPVTVEDDELLPFVLFNVIVNDEQSELYKLNDNVWSYKLDVRDLTIDTEITANQGTISKIQQLYAL